MAIVAPRMYIHAWCHYAQGTGTTVVLTQGWFHENMTNARSEMSRSKPGHTTEDPMRTSKTLINPGTGLTVGH